MCNYFSILVLYWASGPVVNLNHNLLVGWNICYSGDYHVYLHDILDSVLNRCKKTNLLMACRSTNDTNSSCGFAKVGDIVTRTPCDSTFDQDDDFRLCWHTVDPLDGFRCEKAYFNLSTNYFPEQWMRCLYKRGY